MLENQRLSISANKSPDNSPSSPSRGSNDTQSHRGVVFVNCEDNSYFKPAKQRSHPFIHYIEENVHMIQFIRQKIRYLLKRKSYGLVLLVLVFTAFLGLSRQFWMLVSTLSTPNANMSPANEFLTDSNVLVSQLNLASKKDFPFHTGCKPIDNQQPRASAAFVMLARNSEIDDVIKSMISLESHFNKWYNYPWVFLNDKEFDENFKSEVRKHTNADVEFGIIPENEWTVKNELYSDAEIREYIESQGDRQIMYGNLESYHKMCRYYSGFFYKHELVKKRDWYWRVEPDVEFFCDITYDPFIEMEKNNKQYGFTVMIQELYYTVPGLFRETQAFIKKQDIKVTDAWKLFVKDPQYVRGKNSKLYDGITDKEEIFAAMQRNIINRKLLMMKDKTDRFLSKLPLEMVDDLFTAAQEKPPLYEDRMDLEEYNLCHFWSNFEIARTSLFTSKLYQDYFDHLDKSGGFIMERWGDAPIHSLAVGMMLSSNEIHYFRDIGYKHSTLGHCPNNAPISSRQSKVELIQQSFHIDPPSKNGVGCNCKCPPRLEKIENSGGSCIKRWAELTADGYREPSPVDLDYWEVEMERRIDEFLIDGGKLGDVDVAEAIYKQESKKNPKPKGDRV